MNPREMVIAMRDALDKMRSVSKVMDNFSGLDEANERLEEAIFALKIAITDATTAIDTYQRK